MCFSLQFVVCYELYMQSVCCLLYSPGYLFLEGGHLGIGWCDGVECTYYWCMRYQCPITFDSNCKNYFVGKRLFFYVNMYIDNMENWGDMLNTKPCKPYWITVHEHAYGHEMVKTPHNTMMMAKLVSTASCRSLVFSQNFLFNQPYMEVLRTISFKYMTLTSRLFFPWALRYQVRARRTLLQFSDVLLRKRRALLP